LFKPTVDFSLLKSLLQGTYQFAAVNGFGKTYKSKIYKPGYIGYYEQVKSKLLLCCL